VRVLFDINVLLDVLLRREGLVQESARLLNTVEAQQVSGLLCATSVTTIHYLVARHAGDAMAKRSVELLLQLFEVAPVGRAVLEDALQLEFGDFENAVQHEAARHAGTDTIVTRNTKDFGNVTLSVFAPAELLRVLRDL